MGRLVPPHALLHSLNGSVKNILHVGNSVFSDGLLFPSYPHSKQRQQKRQQRQRQQQGKKKVLATGLQFIGGWPQPPPGRPQPSPHASPFPTSTPLPFCNLQSPIPEETSGLVVLYLHIMLKYKEILKSQSVSQSPLSLCCPELRVFFQSAEFLTCPPLSPQARFLTFFSARAFPGNSPLLLACIRNV